MLEDSKKPVWPEQNKTEEVAGDEVRMIEGSRSCNASHTIVRTLYFILSESLRQRRDMIKCFNRVFLTIELRILYKVHGWKHGEHLRSCGNNPTRNEGGNNGSNAK